MEKRIRKLSLTALGSAWVMAAFFLNQPSHHSTIPLFQWFTEPIQNGLCFASEQPTRPAERGNSHFDRAEKLLQEGNYSEAISEYKLSIQENPKDEAAYFGLALAQSQAGQVSQAIQSYQAALQINPKLWQAEINLGMVLLNQQNASEAHVHFKKAQALNPKSFRASYYAGKAQELLQKHSEAEADYLLALGLAEGDPDKFDTCASLATLYLKRRNLAEAEKYFLLARQYQKEPGGVDLNLAQVYSDQGQLDKALDLLLSLMAVKPQEPEIHELMGRLFVEKKDFQAGISSFELAIKYQLDPARRQNLFLEIAQACQQLGQTGRAISYLKEDSKTSTNPGIHFSLGTLYLHERDFEPAKEEFLRALQFNPDCSECYSNLGSIFLLQERYPEAVAALTRFREAKPENAGTYFYLGVAYDKLMDYQNAWSNYQKFLELDQGKTDKQGFQARERMKVLEKKIKKR
jgi:tetratricopeptide (TPR) repeat protein